MEEFNKEIAKEIAKAFVGIAACNHYMVGFVGEKLTLEELEMARQILIAKSNILNNQDTIIERAINLIEMEIKGNKFIKGY
jgi:hypothetical protein